MITFDSPQLMKEKYQFELLNETHYDSLLSWLGTEERARKALKGWNLDGAQFPETLTKNISCMISRVSDGKHLCFVERLLIEVDSTEKKYILQQGGRCMAPEMRDRGELTKDIALEGCYYFFVSCPLNIIEIAVLIPPSTSIEKRVPQGVGSVLDYSSDRTGYKKFVIDKERWLEDTNNGSI